MANPQYSSEEIQKAKDKIKKLVALANDKSNPHESATARRQAENMLKKYGLKLRSEVNPVPRSTKRQSRPTSSYSRTAPNRTARQDTTQRKQAFEDFYTSVRQHHTGYYYQHGRTRAEVMDDIEKTLREIQAELDEIELKRAEYAKYKESTNKNRTTSHQYHRNANKNEIKPFDDTVFIVPLVLGIVIGAIGLAQSNFLLSVFGVAGVMFGIIAGTFKLGNK